jgi:ABC-2 type transport system ATP-binding protein
MISNYRKAYGPTPVLYITGLQLGRGIYWLKGGNGSGKSTLLKSVAGIIPFEGDISLNDINLRKQRMLYTKKVNFAEAEPVYPSFLTGNDLLQFYLQTKGGEPDRIQLIAGRLGMHTYLKTRVSTYSSGMLKKLSLLLAFVGEPALILLDEPFTTLDAEAVDALHHIITGYDEKGVSFLITSHHKLELTTPVTTLHIHQQTIQIDSHVAPLI